MTEQEISEIISTYIVSNWQVIFFGIFSTLGTIGLSTWFVAKHWYQREIKHIECQKQASEEISNKETKYLSKQVEDKETYAKGVIEIMNQRLALSEEKPKNLLKIIKQQEGQLLEFQKRFNEQQKLINTAKKNTQIKVNTKISDETIHFSCISLLHDSRFVNIENTYNELKSLSTKNNRDIEILMLNNLVTLQSKKIIEKNIELKNTTTSSTLDNIYLLKHFIKVIIPLMEKEAIELKPLISEFSEAINKSGVIKDTDSDNS